MHHSNSYRHALRPIDDPLCRAAQLLFASTFDVTWVAAVLADQRELVIRFCFEILDREVLQPGSSYAPLHAVQLLAAWHVQPAIPCLQHILENVDPDHDLAAEAADALKILTGEATPVYAID